MPHDRLDDAAIAAHDRQRRLPPEAHRALVAGLRARLRGRDWCLDAGVGTGNLALPLAAAGVPVVGIDRSPSMLAALRAKGGGAAALPLVRADLTRLPFGEATFGAALAAHVFHLIPDWRAAAAELARVVRPGGLLLVALGSGGSSTEHAALVEAKFREFLGGGRRADAAPVGPRDAAEFEAFVLGLGAAALPPLEVRFRQDRSLEEAIARLERNPFAHPGGAEPAALGRAAAATRAWARGRFGALDSPRPAERAIIHRLYRLPGRTEAPP